MKSCALIFVMALSLGLGLVLQAEQQAPTGPATENRFPPLKLPPGFKATLFACDPLIEYPSVISIGPKPGAIFVAIDYMTGLGSDGKVKSEIRLVEDTDGDGYADKATVAATGFNSIQGLAYHDDTLFVMHAPFLTSVRGKDRKDLLSGLGLKPEDNASRLHCANGVVVGHDGWLYLALGDNGVNIPRPEGDRLIHNAGAILRCRPDGRDLHVFSTGLRNIYDIALDAELNVFTRDNENDGGTYMIRVCHSFFGADHGYPYDYEERPNQGMKPIGDFGRGSSAGGVCYLETQFPKEYRGNLFFGEWGKSVVRYPLTAVNTGFAQVRETDFATGDSKDKYPFKPTDIVVQRDGTMMVSDYSDGQRPKRGRGRIYHIAYVGQDSDPVKKIEQKTPPRTLDAWMQQLQSASHFERWEAQRYLERQSAAELLKTIAAVKKMPPGNNGRLHLIWLMSKMERSNAIDELLTIAKSDGPTNERIQAVRALGDLTDPVLIEHKLDAGRGDEKIAKALATLPNAKNARLLREIAIVLGRLRWAGAPDWLREKLAAPDAAWSHAAMQTLRRADNWPAVCKLLDQATDSDIRPVALRALSDRHELEVVDNLLERLKTERVSNRRREYAELLTRVYKKPAPWKYWGYRPGPRPANTVAWERTDAIAAALDQVLANRDHNERPEVLKHMQREKVPVQLATLAAWLKDESTPSVKSSILTALSVYPAEQVRPHLDAVIRDKNQTAPLRMTALEMVLADKTADAPALLMDYAKALEDGPPLADVLRRLGAFPKSGATPVLTVKLKSPDARVRAAAIEALGELRAPEGRESIVPFLKDPQIDVRRAAAGAAGKLAAKEAIEPLLLLAANPDIETRGCCLDSLRMLGEPRALPFAMAALNERALELKALACFAELGGPSHMKVVADFAKRNSSTDVIAASARALSDWRDRRGATEDERETLDRAIAEIHGAAGILVRWDANGFVPMGSRDVVVKALSINGKKSNSWLPMVSSGAEGRLTLATADKSKSALCFALTDIDVPAATPIEFLASSHGALTIWLNGKSVYQRKEVAKYQVDSDRFAATLEKGSNRVLVEASSISKTAEFHLRFRRRSSKAEHEALTQAALTRPGNAERGRTLFFDKEKSQCIKCHQMAGQGERIGPDLTGVGSRFSRIHVIESILDPGRTIAPSYGTYVIALKNGKTLSGVKLAESDVALTLADNQGAKHVLAKTDIESAELSLLSTMPDGLEQRLTRDEFVDLIAFLASQKDIRAP